MSQNTGYNSRSAVFTRPVRLFQFLEGVTFDLTMGFKFKSDAFQERWFLML